MAWSSVSSGYCEKAAVTGPSSHTQVGLLTNSKSRLFCIEIKLSTSAVLAPSREC